MYSVPLPDLFFVQYQRGNLQLASDIAVVHLMNTNPEILSEQYATAHQLLYNRLLDLEQQQLTLSTEEHLKELVLNYTLKALA
ncbi:MAG: hypothetical protein U0V74_16455 [Chitinophagales bacterium]